MMYKIFTGQFELGTQEQQSVFKKLLGEENIQYKFDFYFHWYNIVHEYGHCLLDYYHKSIGGVKEEVLVNKFAVSFLASAGYGRELQSLRSMINSILERLQNPVPSDMSFIEYYEHIWGTDLLMNVNVYGYLQFQSVLSALEVIPEVSVVLKEMGIENSLNCKMLSYKAYPVNAQTAYNVLSNLHTVLDVLGVEHPVVTLELLDDPTIHCTRKIE